MLQSPLVLAILGIVILPGFAFAVPALADRYGRRSRRVTPTAGMPAVRTDRAWPWLFPVWLLIGPVLLVPLAMTFIYSFQDAQSRSWVGLANYSWALGPQMWPVLINTLIWTILFPIFTVFFALVVALMINDQPYEKWVRTLLVLPAAISGAAAAMIWEQVYVYSPQNRAQVGLLNGIWTGIFHLPPVPWLTNANYSTYALIFIMVWAMMGVALIILSAAVKQVPSDFVEAARLDGAKTHRLLRHIILPLLWPAILTVLTTEFIIALKIFDIIYVLTAGQNGTDVIAHQMYLQLFTFHDVGRASAIAILLLLATGPVIWLNLRQMRRELAK